MNIDGRRFIERLHELGSVGRDEAQRLTRLAADDSDRDARNLFCKWLSDATLEIKIDRIGNIYGIWNPDECSGTPVVMGSHIDTVIDAGIYDGAYGVIAGLGVIEALQQNIFHPSRPIAVVAYTNEEGVRFQPDMMGSLVSVGGLSLETALAATTDSDDRSTLGAELERIGYAGPYEPGFLKPYAYIELHIEQGPWLEAESLAIGAVENLQGISWQRVTINGSANHAGTTPMKMRRDAGIAAAQVVSFVEQLACEKSGVGTVGAIRFEPNVINVIPATASFTVDLRHPNQESLQQMESVLSHLLDRIREKGFSVQTEQLARFEPVAFAPQLVDTIERAAVSCGLSCRRMTSGAGHDAQMISRIAPAAMIFVPSRNGASHSPSEYTSGDDLINGANLLLDVVATLSRQ